MATLAHRHVMCGGGRSTVGLVRILAGKARHLARSKTCGHAQAIARVRDLKSIAFAILIGASSCHIGLKAGRSAADVGLAATRAVVTGIVGVIALDATFAVLADVIGL